MYCLHSHHRPLLPISLTFTNVLVSGCVGRGFPNGVSDAGSHSCLLYANHVENGMIGHNSAVFGITLGLPGLHSVVPRYSVVPRIIARLGESSQNMGDTGYNR